MIWVHCGNTDNVQVTLSLALRIIEYSDPETVVITGDAHDLPAFDDLPTGVARLATPIDSPTKVRDFLDEWAPGYLIWNGGTLRPALLRQVANANIPAILINANVADLLPSGTGWRPRATRTAVAAFSKILTTDGATASRLTRGGVGPGRIETPGPILEDPLPLPHNPNEMTVMAEALGTRPVWLAANVTADEIRHIAEAHLEASRKNHRLLLVLVPRDDDSGPKIGDTFRDAGFKVAVRSEGEDPEAEQQVYIADLPDELGMWYRLIPLTFMGGTMSGGGASSPFEPILLGSAVVHGTRWTPHSARFRRLAGVEACREIRSATELGIAVSVLVSPEQTARMAFAGWEEITRNARTINQIVATALDLSTAEAAS